MAAPRASARQDGIAQRLRGRAVDLDPLEFPLREEAKGPAVRRPERKGRAVGLRQRTRFERLEWTDPEQLPAILAERNEGQLPPVW